MRKDYPALDSPAPYKKRRGQRLTPEQKNLDRELASERAVAQHSISRLEKFRILDEKFRNRLRWQNRTTYIVTGLVNFRIMGATL